LKLLFHISNLFIIFLSTGCLQTYNSNSGQDQISALKVCAEAGTVAGDRYCEAETIIQNNCINCHTGHHNQWSAYVNDEDWIRSGRVIQNNVNASNLLLRMKNIGGDMPLDNPRISDSEFVAIYNWIENMP
jgi:mono/diheme cytochrome c family protein